MAAGSLGALDVLDVLWCNGVPWEPGAGGLALRIKNQASSDRRLSQGRC